MTHDSMEFFDIHKSILRDRGIDSLYGDKTPLRYRQKTIPGKIFPRFQAVVGRILLKSGRFLISLGEDLVRIQTCGAGVSRSSETRSFFGGFAR